MGWLTLGYTENIAQAELPAWYELNATARDPGAHPENWLLGLTKEHSSEVTLLCGVSVSRVNPGLYPRRCFHVYMGSLKTGRPALYEWSRVISVPSTVVSVAEQFLLRCVTHEDCCKNSNLGKSCFGHRNA